MVGETSNPAWIYRKYLQGWRRNGDLIAGMGLPASRINEDEIKAWGSFCDTLRGWSATSSSTMEETMRLLCA